MGWVCLSVTPLLQRVQNRMCEGNKGNQPERELETEAKPLGLHFIIYFLYFEAQFTYEILQFTNKPMS